jgi:hypothetical protein
MLPTISSADAQTFHGYPCTVECSGHEAGFDWAEQNGITNSSDCGGNSNSFIDGCEAWADENGSDEYSDDYSGDDLDLSGDDESGDW